MNGIAYNERSWAIDLIAHIKNLVTAQNRSIKDAGGEQTVQADGGNLFPDVLLFGDQSLALILQGWELKMPDTSIDDPDFHDNATKKARALGLDSFVLWNVSVARLYTKTAETDNFALANEWNDLVDIKNRRSVVPNRDRWQKVATDIVNYVNDLLDRNVLEGRPFVDAYRSGGITGLIMANADSVRENLKNAANRNVRLNAQVTLWWNFYNEEYGGNDRFAKLAQANISNWIGKFLFAHILQGRDVRAQTVTRIGDNTTPEQALGIFEELSRDCNFWPIFSADAIGLASLPERTWNHLLQLNQLLSDLRIGSIDQAQLSGILGGTVEVAVRKLRGQYPTPASLARLLIQLTVQNVQEGRVLDPCCGSGTIARAALEQKLSTDVDPEQAASMIYAGDNDPFAVQLATFALAKPELMHMPLKVFRYDAFLLETDTELQFRNPTTGEPLVEEAGLFNAIASNLPFVSQNGRPLYEDAIERVSDLFGGDGNWLPRKADIAAYLPFVFHSLLEDGGRLGIIITNAWLSTAWGDTFRKRIGHYYNLKTIVTSGAGRWFKESDVVTNILILEKVPEGQRNEDSVDFVVLKEPLEELDRESVEVTAAQIELGYTESESVMIHSVSYEHLERFRPLGLGGNAQFVNCDWVLLLPLIPLRRFFSISRGERRGWDKMFYPPAGHGIEPRFIRPMLKNSRNVKRYIASADGEAFSCSATIEDLEENGYIGAVNWIRRFENQNNTDGKPLTQSLSRAGHHWYEMKTAGLTELAMPLNVYERIFVFKLDPPTFVNQRLIRLNPLDGIDVDLCHALLNTAVSMFLIEGNGFGRGLGVLDLNKNRIEGFMSILDPSLLDERQIKDIKAAFAPLLEREILEIADELERDDRQHFDETVLAAFGIEIPRQEIYDSLCRLVAIRLTVRDHYN